MRQVNILFYDKRITRWMQHAGMFERWKVIGVPTVATVIDDYGPANAARAADHCESASDFGIVAIYDDRVTYYRNPNVKAVSNGQSWGLLDDLLLPSPVAGAAT